MDKYNGMKRARDWVGKRIRSVESMQNGYVDIPVDSKGIVLAQSPTGLRIKFDKCECCGVSAFISKVTYFSIKLDN